MTADDVRLTRFGPHHLDEAVALSAGLGWPHRREDWDLLRTIGEGVAAVSGDRLLGTAFMTPYGPREAAINMVIVDAALRGRGLGRRLMEAALDLAGDRACRLIATPDGRPLYQKLGFVAVGEIGQHQGAVGPLPTEPPPAQAVSWGGAADWVACLELDRAAFGADRAALFDGLARTGTLALLRGSGGIDGFAVRRPFGRGETLGPVVARDEAAARALIGFFLADRQGRFLRLDAPLDGLGDTGLSPWLDAHGLNRVDTALAMRRGPPTEPVPDASRSYALVSQAFG